KMYIKNILINNYGALSSFNLEFPFNENGSPKPIVLVGKNGSGKTLLTSSIVDSLIEIKRANFRTINETKENSYYKAGKKDYITVGENYSFVRVEFSKGDGSSIYYNDIASTQPTKTRELLQHYNINLNQEFIDYGFSKTINGDTKGIFEKNAILYFPVNRYYNPAWLVDSDDPRIQTVENYVGQSNDNFIKTNVIKEIESWILDVILDSELYEKIPLMVQAYIPVGNNFIPIPG
ncbi:AAA family ATPase, partial [Salmonella enterica]|nr:AAA family ATPase [Salmonella enterica]